jgi:GT2 family glycosyltransferase
VSTTEAAPRPSQTQVDRGSTPRVSVIIPAYNSEATIAATLDALAEQTFTDFETVVVDSSPGEATAQLVAARFPDVVLHHSSERLLPHAARNRGVELARGELLVFTDPDCVARRDWLSRLIAAHEEGHPVVGGAIANQGGGWINQGIHVSKFAPWTGEAAPGARGDLATANVLWRRSLWERVGPFPSESWCGDTELSWRARAEGVELRFDPRAVVGHTHTTGLRAFWRERLARGDDFARMRMRVESWPRGRAALHLVLAPLVPGLLLVRALGHASRGGGFRKGLVTAPVQLLGYVAWSLGEARAFASATIR